MNNLDLILDLTNAKGAPGFEDEVIAVLNQYKGDYVLHVDVMKNAYINFGEIDESKPTVMIDSHLDEVALMVQAIDSNGLLTIQPLGGWVPNNLTAQQFYVRNADGKYYKGIAVTKPVHFMTAEERTQTVKMSDIKIDLGVTSREEVIEKFRITVGQPIVPVTTSEFNPLNEVITAKALDNRIGCAVALTVMHELYDELAQLPFNLVAAFAAQEEVGARGAKVTVNRVQPDIAIVLEGTPSDDFTNVKELEQARLGAGPQIRHRDSSYINNEKLLTKLAEVAKNQQIPVQHAVREGGGTNAGSIHTANLGVPVAVIGVPSRYVHTHVGFGSYCDFEATVALVKHFLLSLTTADFDTLGFYLYE